MNFLSRFFGCFGKKSIGSNNTDSIVDESSSGTENVRNDDGSRVIDTDFGGGSNDNNSVDNGDISAMSPFSLDDNNNIFRNDDGRRFIDTTEWCYFRAVSPFSLDGNNNNDGTFNNNDEDDGEDNSLSLYGNNNNNSTASNDNDNSNSNDNGNNNEIHSTPANSTIAATRTVIGSRSPMPTRATTPKLDRCRHAQLASDRTPQEIWYNKNGKITIVGDLDHTGVDNIENYNNNAIENYNNNNEEEEEEEEEELPSKQLFK